MLRANVASSGSAATNQLRRKYSDGFSVIAGLLKYECSVASTMSILASIVGSQPACDSRMPAVSVGNLSKTPDAKKAANVWMTGWVIKLFVYQWYSRASSYRACASKSGGSVAGWIVTGVRASETRAHSAS